MVCAAAGTASATLPLELARASELRVFVQLEDEAKVEALRKSAEAAGLLGSRLYVARGSLKHLHLANDLADAVVAGEGADRAEVLRVLRPGGKALILALLVILAVWCV